MDACKWDPRAHADAHGRHTPLKRNEHVHCRHALVPAATPHPHLQHARTRATRATARTAGEWREIALHVVDKGVQYVPMGQGMLFLDDVVIGKMHLGPTDESGRPAVPSPAARHGIPPPPIVCLLAVPVVLVPVWRFLLLKNSQSAWGLWLFWVMALLIQMDGKRHL